MTKKVTSRAKRSQKKGESVVIQHHTPKGMKSIEKYPMYENAVQTPDLHAQCFDELYQEIFDKKPKVLREDFCGTFQICMEWVKLDQDKVAYGLDLDPEPLHYGKKVHLKKLTAEQKKRVTPLKQNVITSTRPKADVCVACNFSFFIFKTQEELLRYFKKVYESLAPDSVFFLEMAGGAGMYEKTKERRRYQRNKKHWYTYIWDQKSFDPINHHGEYAIHFKLPNGKTWENAFTYDWRMWTMPEVRDLLAQAGFDDSYIYWDESDSDDPDVGIYSRRTKGDNDHAWITLVAGVKRGRKGRSQRSVNGSHQSSSTRRSRGSKRSQ